MSGQTEQKQETCRQVQDHESLDPNGGRHDLKQVATDGHGNKCPHHDQARAATLPDVLLDVGHDVTGHDQADREHEDGREHDMRLEEPRLEGVVHHGPRFSRLDQVLRPEESEARESGRHG